MGEAGLAFPKGSQVWKRNERHKIRLSLVKPSRERIHDKRRRYMFKESMEGPGKLDNMPDVSRSDSTRSDGSRPRVSFNRNVHVKRINPPNTANAYSLSSDGTSLVPTSIRRERPLTKKEMTKEAEVVLKQVDKLSCTATSSLKLEDDKLKAKKKRKDTFSFLKKNEKPEKVKGGSSDLDSGSSQEYRIYRVNAPLDKNKHDENDVVQRVMKNKANDFMSLDRKRLKKLKKKESLDYLSLEENNEVLEKMIRRPNRTLISMVFDNKENSIRKSTGPLSTVESKQGNDNTTTMVGDSDLKCEKAIKKREHSPIVNSEVLYSDKERVRNVERMVKKLTEKAPPKIMKNKRLIAIKEPQYDSCHNENRPFSYTNGEKSEFELNLDVSNAESLVDSVEELKCTSPTSDVIYAQVMVGGRDCDIQKATVNERVTSNEVGRVFVGEDLKSQVGKYYKTNSQQNDEIVTVNSDNIFKKEKFEDTKMSADIYLENQGHGDQNYRSSESDLTSSSPFRDGYTKVVKITPQCDVNRNNDRPSDLHDLSIRREILLSRSESQAKERFNSLKRLQEPTLLKRHASMLNDVRHDEKPPRNETQRVDDGKKVNEKTEGNLKKKSKEVEIPATRKRENLTLDTLTQNKEGLWKNSDKVHVIKTDDDDDDNILRKLSRLGKSKSFIQDKPKFKKMGKMKMLFKKKKDGKNSGSEDDPLVSRYIEYRGSDVDLSDRSNESAPRRDNFKLSESQKNSGRKQGANSSLDAMRTLTKIKNNTNKDSDWLQSLNKRGAKISKKKFNDISGDVTNYSKSTSLRFFGDTDQESTTNEHNFDDPMDSYHSGKIIDSEGEPSRPDSRNTNSSLKGSTMGKHKSKYDLDKPDYGVKQMKHGLNMTLNKFDTYPLSTNEQSDTYDLNGVKYGSHVIRSVSSVTQDSKKYSTKQKLRNFKSTPVTSALSSPNGSLARRVMSHGNLYNQEDKQGGRRKFYDSSAESATEGDSSQHSSKSMIYLHAATVGDIPGPRNIYKSERRSDSKEELNSTGDNSVMVPTGKKTLSRSISVLAPWRPKHNKEDRAVHYDPVDYNKAKPPTGIDKNKRSSSKERKSNEFRFNTIGKENRRRKDLLR
ncbi:hypothetical protein RUM44_002377 [Polyplax serrata]|uniref:Uncharacterized protein n=1 Tax=Polyplax serrata TaxID=468196 RepID=A0ABR1AMP4_POLSC